MFMFLNMNQIKKIQFSYFQLDRKKKLFLTFPNTKMNYFSKKYFYISKHFQTQAYLEFD